MRVRKPTKYPHLHTHRPHSIFFPQREPVLSADYDSHRSEPSYFSGAYTARGRLENCTESYPTSPRAGRGGSAARVVQTRQINHNPTYEDRLEFEKFSTAYVAVDQVSYSEGQTTSLQVIGKSKAKKKSDLLQEFNRRQEQLKSMASEAGGLRSLKSIMQLTNDSIDPKKIEKDPPQYKYHADNSHSSGQTSPAATHGSASNGGHQGAASLRVRSEGTARWGNALRSSFLPGNRSDRQVIQKRLSCISVYFCDAANSLVLCQEYR
jgi:hypothetical protein